MKSSSPVLILVFVLVLVKVLERSKETGAQNAPVLARCGKACGKVR